MARDLVQKHLLHDRHYAALQLSADKYNNVGRQCIVDSLFKLEEVTSNNGSGDRYHVCGLRVGSVKNS